MTRFRRVMRRFGKDMNVLAEILSYPKYNQQSNMHEHKSHNSAVSLIPVLVLVINLAKCYCNTLLNIVLRYQLQPPYQCVVISSHSNT